MGVMSNRMVGLNTLAVCESCGRFVDVPLATKALAIATFDHRTDWHPEYEARLRPLSRVADPQGLWDAIIRSTRPPVPGRRLL